MESQPQNAELQINPENFHPCMKPRKAVKCENTTANVLKFPTLVACQKGPDKQGRPRSDCF